jgi:hypothetical protein
MAPRRWEGAISFEKLSQTEREQIRQELEVRRAAPTALQPKSTALTDITGLAKTDGNVIVGDGTNWVAESGATARTSLGLGTGNSPTFTALNLAQFIDFTEITAPSAPSALHARLWTEDNNGFSVLHWKDAQSLDHEVSRDLVHIVRNNSGGTIAMGEVVYVSGATGTVPTVAKARANSATTMPPYGLATGAISNNSFGQVMTAGDIQGLDTSGFAAGDFVYVSAATAGLLTATAPTGTNIPERVGIVLRSHATQGIIGITIGAATLPQQGAIADPTGGATTDTEARAAIVSILTALRTLGLIAT